MTKSEGTPTRSDDNLSRLCRLSGRVRWAKRKPQTPGPKDGLIVLQQEWEYPYTGEREWRDVPTVTEGDE